MLASVEKELDCFDLEIIAEKFSDWKICKQHEITHHQCYLLLWYLFCGNINPRLINDIPLAVIAQAKNYILWRKLYDFDSKRPEDIEAHYSNICRYIQLNKHLEPTGHA